jgi:hypothetical protein
LALTYRAGRVVDLEGGVVGGEALVEQLLELAVGIGLRSFPRVEPPRRRQRWSVEPNRDRWGVRSCRAHGHESGAHEGLYP